MQEVIALTHPTNCDTLPATTNSVFCLFTPGAGKKKNMQHKSCDLFYKGQVLATNHRLKTCSSTAPSGW
jgi:hypothetical protein